MSKFTKGPYRVAHNASAICAGESMTLARVYWSKGRSEEENRANADLFAAAPEMYDALKDWLYYAEQTLGEFDVKGDECDPEGSLCPRCEAAGCIQRKIRNARAALAKAGATP